MKLIPLTQGKFAMVDDEDFDWLNQWKWYAAMNRRFYCRRSVWKNKKTVKIKMHRLILGLTDSKILVDHKDGNTLNNQKNNLRICIHSQNMRNRKSYGTSKYLGVCWNKLVKGWMAQIRHNKKVIYLGFYKDEIEAAKVYDAKAKELNGEFANLNFKTNPTN